MLNRAMLLDMVVVASQGCGLSLPGASVENYERVEIGMEYSEVLDILGKPDSSSSGYVVGGGSGSVERLNEVSWTVAKDGRVIEIRLERDPLLRTVVKEKRIRPPQDEEPESDGEPDGERPSDRPAS